MKFLFVEPKRLGILLGVARDDSSVCMFKGYKICRFHKVFVSFVSFFLRLLASFLICLSFCLLRFSFVFHSLLLCVSYILLHIHYFVYWFVFRIHSIAYFRCFIQYVLLRFISHCLLARSLFVCVYFDCLHIHYCVSYSFYWCLPAT